MAASIAVRKEAPSTKSLVYSIAEHSFSLNERGAGFALAPDRTTASEDGFAFIRTRGNTGSYRARSRDYAFPDQAQPAHYQNAGFLADLEAAYEAELDNIFISALFVSFRSRDYLWARSRPTDVGRKGEKAIDAILAATSKQNERRNLRPRARLMPFPEMIAHWLQQMGLIHTFRVEEIAKGSNRWQALVQTKPGTSGILFLTDVGFGVSQVLPVVTLLQYVPDGATVILEQPEIHLHPLAQAALADVIIQAAKHRHVQELRSQRPLRSICSYGFNASCRKRDFGVRR